MPLTVEMFAGNWNRSSNPLPERSASRGTTQSKTPPDTRRVTKCGLKRNRAGFKNENCAQNFSDRLAAGGGRVAAERIRWARSRSHPDGCRCPKLPTHPGQGRLGPIPEGHQRNRDAERENLFPA